MKYLSLVSAALMLGIVACSSNVPPADTALRQIADRTLIRELMDRYGTVHDSGTPEQYADLFSPDGEIAIGGGPVLVKGREALMEQARRDHDRFGETDANGRWTSIMRHLISNAQITLRFVSQLISSTKDRSGAVIDGSSEKVIDVTDVWTFARDLSSRDPNWKLVGTGSAQ